MFCLWQQSFIFNEIIHFPPCYFMENRKTQAYCFSRIKQTRPYHCLNRGENVHNIIFRYARDTADVSAAQRKFTAQSLHESVGWLLSAKNHLHLTHLPHAKHSCNDLIKEAVPYIKIMLYLQQPIDTKICHPCLFCTQWKMRHLWISLLINSDR